MAEENKVLYSEFLRDPREYALAAYWWRHLVDSICRECRMPRWEQWFRDSFVDGTKMRDANPLFSAIHPQRTRAIRVIQLSPSEASGMKRKLTVEIERNDAEREWPDSEWPEEQLVIQCVLKRRFVGIIRELLAIWVQGKDTATVKAYIREHDLIFE